ncbi:MAG TPA: hemerythrin domain-containing protein [Acidobacteriota bacterium]|nr:hemerythrin domain-containing protein [Acidobacteriota bacterium]
MNTATGTLRKEHEAILKMLDAAEEAARQLTSNIPVAPEILSDLLEFLRTFADRCHHSKEEDLLFPALEERGLPRQGGPIGVMLHEHEQGRSLIRQMGEASEAYAAGDANAAQIWAIAARTYAGLLRSHIMKENNILFVMAERILTQSEQEALSAAFDKVEIEKLGAGTHERLHALMDRLLAEVFPKVKAAV